MIRILTHEGANARYHGNLIIAPHLSGFADLLPTDLDLTAEQAQTLIDLEGQHLKRVTIIGQGQLNGCEAPYSLERGPNEAKFRLTFTVPSYTS